MSDNAFIDDDGLLYSNRFQDHYYSRHDGRAESVHVFLNGNGLPGRWSEKPHFTIGELGFGSGLNFLQTWATWIETRKPGQSLQFVSVEGYPLTASKAKIALEKWPQLQPLVFTLLRNWNRLEIPCPIDDQTTLQVLQGPVENMLHEFPLVDAWYLDGFAPLKNPDMWSENVMQMIADHSAKGGTCASYTAAGWVRRNLETAGFEIEKRAGFGSKRHMIAGVLA